MRPILTSAILYELRAGDTLNDIDIRLPIDGLHPLRVHLTTPDGRPITFAAVTLTDTTDDSLIFQVANEPTQAAGRETGLYEFRSIPSGTYTLLVRLARIMPSFDPANLPPPPAPNPDSDADPNAPEIQSSVQTFTMPHGSMFADSTTTVFIKDSDPADITLTLNPAPAPTAPPPP